VNSSISKRNKYHAKPTVMNGIRFDSRKEARIWLARQLEEQAGAISELKRQVMIPIFVAGVKVCSYRADYTYIREGKYVVEDAKGFQTDIFKLKWKMLKAQHPEWSFVIS